MPRHQEPMKDATNGETPWGAVSMQRSMDIRMGKPGMLETCHKHRLEGTQRIEISKQLQEKKVKTILLVATSERGAARYYNSYKTLSEKNDLGKSTKEGESPVIEATRLGYQRVRRGT